MNEQNEDWGMDDRAEMTKDQLQTTYTEAPGEMCEESLDMIFDSLNLLGGVTAELQYNNEDEEGRKQIGREAFMECHQKNVEDAAICITAGLVGFSYDPEGVMNQILKDLGQMRGKPYLYKF
jgi:hypothetical protein